MVDTFLLMVCRSLVCLCALFVILKTYSAAGAPLRNVAAAWGGMGGATAEVAPRQNFTAF